jgi:hypothetical protein
MQQDVGETRHNIGCRYANIAVLELHIDGGGDGRFCLCEQAAVKLGKA